MNTAVDIKIEQKINLAENSGELAQVEFSHIQKVFEAEKHIANLPPVELLYKHYFSHGVYAREMNIPANTYVTGHIHKYTNLNILLKGKMSLMTENGQIEVCAPYIVVSPPGTKRIAFAYEDCIWITIHGTNETDLEKIEETFIAHSYEEYLAFCAKQLKEGV